MNKLTIINMNLNYNAPNIIKANRISNVTNGAYVRVALTCEPSPHQYNTTEARQISVRKREGDNWHKSATLKF